MRLLGVLLCYNDADLLEDSIRYLREQAHDIILWDHGSTDETPDVIARLRNELLEVQHIPREFDFYELYPRMSRYLIDNLVHKYDWISWGDQDEFLEGPNRQKSYAGYLREVFESEHNWIRFNNYNFWFTGADDPAEKSAPKRVRHYCLFPDCAPRIRSWRASATNIRQFNHNPPIGSAWPVYFNLRHYPMRSQAQMIRRLERDRFGLRRGNKNFHYENMLFSQDRLRLRPDQLHFDDGHSELNPELVFQWRSLYGLAPMGAAQ